MEAAILESKIQMLREIAPGSIGDQFAFRLLSWDSGTQTAVFSCQTEQWMQNAMGTLHGGMSAAILDQAMGFLAFSMMPGEGIAPSIQLQADYLRPLMPGKTIVVSVQPVHISRTMMHLRGTLANAERPDAICVSGSGIYYFKPLPAAKK